MLSIIQQIISYILLAENQFKDHFLYAVITAIHICDKVISEECKHCV